MCALTTWRWNPVLGEYEPGEPRRRPGTGELSGTRAYSDKPMVLLGGSGFVGQVLLALVHVLNAKLVHDSTSYVAGKKDGRVPENTSIEGYFPERDKRPNEKFSVAEELKWYEHFIEETRGTRATNPKPVRERLREGGL